MFAIKKHWPFILGLILSSSVLWPLFAAPYFTQQDDVTVIRTYEMSKCFLDGQIPCRWVPDLGGLYGYPMFNYYAPLSYYVGAISYLITGGLLLSFKLLFIISFLGSYIFMYLLASKFWGKLGGSLSAVFYAYAPYHAVDFYVRGAMGEMWALMFFPAIFWASYKLFEVKSVKNLLLLALCIAGLMTSHNLSAMIFLPITLVWLGILYFKDRSKRFLWFSLISVFLGFMLASFYFLPLVFEKDLVHVETTVEGYFSYTEHFKGLRKLFIDRYWGYGPSVREVPGGEKDGLPYQIGWVHTLAWALAIFSAIAFWKKNRWLSLTIGFFSLIAIGSVFMIHPRSEFVWRLIDPLKYLQFPWRFLMLVIFALSFMSGSIIYYLEKDLFKKSAFGTLIILVVVLNFVYFRPEKFVHVTDAQLLGGANWNKQIMRSIFDYLPISAKEPPADLATSRYEILTGKAEVSNFTQGTDWFNFTINTQGYTIIRLSQYYFPDWRIQANGKDIYIDYKSNSLGLMTLILDKGSFQVVGRLYDTPVRSVGNLLSGFAILLCIGMYLTQIKKVRKWLFYYLKAIN